jgi:uncharacterized protein with PQ loop repeat
MTQSLGWASSLILLATIATQIYKQWQSGSSQGVSKWLFIGQLSASIGFTIYSWLLHNWIFVITNFLMILNSLVGLGIVFWHRYHQSKMN